MLKNIALAKYFGLWWMGGGGMSVALKPDEDLQRLSPKNIYFTFQFLVAVW